MDEQLRRCGKSKAFFPVFDLYMELQCLLFDFVGMELLFLCKRRLRIQRCIDTVGSDHDGIVRRGIFVHIKHDHERNIWNSNRHRDHR